MQNPNINTVVKMIEIAEQRLALLKQQAHQADLTKEEDVIECRILIRDVITPLNIGLTDLTPAVAD